MMKYWPLWVLGLRCLPAAPGPAPLGRWSTAASSMRAEKTKAGVARADEPAHGPSYLSVMPRLELGLHYTMLST
ncbi:unnamed protein product [Arctogadus glacialis]